MSLTNSKPAELHQSITFAESNTKIIKTRPSSEKVPTYYSELMHKIKEAGLLKKVPSFYIKRLIAITLFASALWFLLYLTSVYQNPWTIVAAFPIMALQGVMAAQYGFIAHETAHRQVFYNNHVNDNWGRILANGFAGLSYGFWMNKHNRHHNKPNQIGYDPDIDINVISFTTESLENKKGLEKTLSKNQGWLFPFLLTMTGFHLLLDSFISLGRKDKDRRLNHRVAEFSMMVFRQSMPIIILFILFPPLIAGALWLTMFMSFGLFMGGAFAPNHKGMPLVPKDAKIDFFQRQVLTSRNIRSTWLTDNLMGGLNFQVEHHLFPSMARPHLKKAHQIVVEYCNEKRIPFVETGLFQSYGIIIKHLNKVGLSNNSDPFVCPMIATLRPRN